MRSPSGLADEVFDGGDHLVVRRGKPVNGNRPVLAAK